ncbi:MAG: hypothetical protein R3E10_00350 [Gemmatimonadota bacterium]
MFGAIRRLIGAVFTGALLLVTAYAGWRWGDRVFPALEERIGIEAAAPSDAVPGQAPSERVASAARARVEGLRGREGQAELNGLELTSLLRFDARSQVPASIVDPVVEIQDGRLELSGRLVVADVSNLPDLRGTIDVLPDTVEVSVIGTLIPFDGQGSAFLVDRIRLARIPLPRKTAPSVIASLDRARPPGLPEQALYVRLPAGLRSAYVEGDRLVIVSGQAE